MKKRLCSAVLALALCLALPCPALAAEEASPQSYEEIFETCTFGWNVEERLEAPGCTAVLMWSDLVGLSETEHVRDYALALISKENMELEQQFRRLVLPSTAEVGGQYPQYPTHRAPDALSLNEDGSVLTYVYRFDDTLANDAGELLHDAGTYTYRVDTATGELKVELEKRGETAGKVPLAEGSGNGPVPGSPPLEAERTTFVDVASADWFAPYVEVCVETGLMKGVGGGRFDPQGTVTLAQAATLAARIHHIKNGGDGKLPQAPENYGVLTVTFENGKSLTFDSSEYHATIAPMSSGFAAVVSPERLATLDWISEEDDTPATITAALAETSGPIPCRAYWNGPKENGRLGLRPRLDASEEERSTFYATTSDLNFFRRPLPGDWFRDTVYYLESALGASEARSVMCEWKWGANGSVKTATRGDFVEALHATAADMLTPKLNDITDFPDAEPEYDGKGLADLVLDFYNAGVMTGNDELGTFGKELPLTRAEAATICARILKPELRVRFQPFPVPEKVSYTLTYLMDDPMEGHTVTYPVLPIITNDGVNNGILTLDGDLLPWPGDGDGPVGMLGGNGLYLSFWFTQPDGTRVEKGGLMDETGTFVVPLNDYCYRATSLSSGKYLSQTGLPENGVCTLWDEEGNATELGSMDWYEAIEANGGYRASGWAPDIDRGRYCYVDDLGHRVSENFDWLGALTDSGRGFVGKDGKLYRIQFERK